MLKRANIFLQRKSGDLVKVFTKSEVQGETNELATRRYGWTSPSQKGDQRGVVFFVRTWGSEGVALKRVLPPPQPPGIPSRPFLTKGTGREMDCLPHARRRPVGASPRQHGTAPICR